MRLLSFASIAALTITAFSSSAAPSTTPQTLASANTGFAFKLLNEVAKEQPAQNIFISPYSVSTVLQMVGNGAGGKTRDELRKVLGTTDLTPAAANEAARDINRAITGGCTNVVLNSANAIWYRKGIQVKPEFLACNRDFFQAAVDPLNFDDPAAVGIMNSWVSQMTHGRIPSIVSGPIDPLTRLFLANAVYFKGKWLDPFEAKATKSRPFHLQGGQRKNLLMMEQSKKFTYRRGTGYQAVRLPYMDWDLAMYVFLPDAGSSPQKLLAIMNADSWQRITLPGFSEQEGHLVLPRFKLQYGIDLQKPLKALGITNAFQPEKADFSGMTVEPVFISEATQKTFLEVNEEGTEAAATTMMNVASAGPAMNPPKPFEMIVDRPFLVIIHHAATQSILFMGVVFDPGA